MIVESALDTCNAKGQLVNRWPSGFLLDTMWFKKKCISQVLIIPCSLLFQDDQGSTDKSDDLVRVLRELTVVQRNIANLQVELQGRKVMC